MRFSVLSSGSKANCTFVESARTRILIDCGLSAGRTEERLRALGIRPELLDAIIVTHEHSDHIKGISVLSRRYKLPVFANTGAAEFLGRIYGHEPFQTGTPFWVGDLKIHPCSIVHDAADPVGIVVENSGLKFANFTDLGRATPLVRDALRGAHAIVLESNHDEDMLRECGYPWELKQRILSTHGHLSNHSAGALIEEVMHGDLGRLVLGHISENSNTPEVAMRTVRSYIQAKERLSSELICGSPYESTPLFEIGV
ncbi:MAG: MBL fold metallo-hydrolase [Proteobacteria bacterium]|nr:MAG: MBL fold metallo-hydrolase [Pseudomonadota bacterium]